MEIVGLSKWASPGGTASPEIPQGARERQRYDYTITTSAGRASPPGPRLRSCGVLLQLLLDVHLRDGAHDLVDDLAVLEEQQHRDGPDVEARRGLDVRVHIELGDLHLARVFHRDLVENGRDHAARSA